MISYMPEIYPDELAYSWFCRYYVHSGCLTHKMALSDILCKRSCNPSKEFLGNLNPEMQRKIQEIYPIKTLIFEHTMFNQYGRFIPLAQKEKALYHLEYDFRDVHHLFSVLPRGDTDRFLKYCPICAEEDRQKYGETYWHRNHQIRGMQVCYKHNCMLENSDITAKSEQTFTFCPAEEYAVKRNANGIKNAPSRRYAEYITAIFDAPIDIANDIPISAVLYYAMANTCYMKSTGKNRYTKRFTEDLTAFYKNYDIGNIASIYQIQRLLLGDRFDFSVVCQIAFFLGISVEDLTAPKITKAQIEKEQATHYMKDKIPLDWQEYDNELAPILEQVANDIYTGAANNLGRPERVSERMIYRELELSAHRLENLPKCRAIFESYTESYEENWARRIVWAYEKLKASNAPFYWSDIRRLTGVKKQCIEAIMPFLYKYIDKENVDIIKMLQAK